MAPRSREFLPVRSRLALVVAAVIAAAEGSGEVNWPELLANLPFGQASGRRRRK